jgi:C-terminal processing protease CtpA/Prc
MRNVMVVGLVAILAISLMITGTILAQDSSDDDSGVTWLGIQFAETDEGITVTRVVSGSPAAAGGLLIGDVILSIDGEPVESADALTDMVQTHTPGDVVSVVVDRNGTDRTLEIELGSTASLKRDGRRDRFGTTDVDSVMFAERMLGVNLDAVDGGYEVTAVGERHGFTIDSEFEEGDIITAINGQSLDELDWSALMTELAEMEEPTLTVSVVRNGEEITIESSLPGAMWEMHTDEFGDFHRHGSGGRGGDFDGAPFEHRTAPDSEQSDSTETMAPITSVESVPA